METELNYDQTTTVSEICEKYQAERASGRWYITQTGLNKVAKFLGGDYKMLTKKQKTQFRGHCVDQAMEYLHSVKTWWYYINI